MFWLVLVLPKGRGWGCSRGSGEGSQGYLLLLPWELGVMKGGGSVLNMLALLVGVAETNSSAAAVRSACVLPVGCRVCPLLLLLRPLVGHVKPREWSPSQIWCSTIKE